jgi:hypothetical protein
VIDRIYFLVIIFLVEFGTKPRFYCKNKKIIETSLTIIPIQQITKLVLTGLA